MKHRIKYFFIDFAFYGKAFVALTWSTLRRGECFVVESGFCCDTGRFASERRYRNPWSAVRSFHYLNTVDWSDGGGRAYVGDGTMWREDYLYSEAPHGWDELRRDREAEDDERFENECRGGM